MAHILRKAPLSNKSYRFCYGFAIVLAVASSVGAVAAVAVNRR